MAFLLPIVGFAIGGPWGALIGGFLQQIFFPPEGPKGPRLNELNVQRSTVGAPVQIRYGTAAGAGNIIWSGGLIEIKHEDEQGGFLGIGGVTTTSYTYSVDFAVGICEGEDGSPCQPAGIRRLWAGSDLIYDASDDATLIARYGDTPETTEFIAGLRAMSAQLDFVFYDGSADQLPDPTIESYEIAGTVPAFRGLAYVVFNDFQLEKYGNQIPNIRIETYSGTPTECGLYSAGSLYQWEFENDYNTNDPRNPLNNHLYHPGDTGMQPCSYTLAAAVAQKTANWNGRPWLISEAFGRNYGDNPYIQGWATSTTPNDMRPCDAVPANGDYVVVAIRVNSIHGLPSDRYDCSGAGGPALPPNTEPEGDTECHQILEYQAQSLHGTGSANFSGWYALGDDGVDPAELFEGITSSQGVNGTGECLPPEPIQQWKLLDQEILVERTIQPPDPCAYGTPLAGAPGYCVINGQITQGITWTQVSGTFKVLQRYAETGSLGVVTKYPIGPALRSDDPSYNDQAYWEGAYAQALADGAMLNAATPMPGDWVYGVDYPETQSTAYFSECDTVDTACVPMAIIAADICRRCGLRTDTSTQIDVSGLTSCVPGYIIGRQMSGREALGPLRMFGLWDATESQGLLRFVERGAAIVESLTADDLGAHENGSQAPTAVEVSRVQEKDLPRRLRLHFANFLHDHEVSEQAASRISTEAIDEV